MIHYLDIEITKEKIFVIILEGIKPPSEASCHYVISVLKPLDFVNWRSDNKVGSFWVYWDLKLIVSVAIKLDKLLLHI